MQALQSLRLSDQRFQNLVREATVGILVLRGAEMRVDLVNKAPGRLIDFKPADLPGKPLFDPMPDAEAFFRRVLDKVRLTGALVYLYDQVYGVAVSGKKTEGYLNVVYQPYREANGTIVGVIALCQDVTKTVTARKATEESEDNLHNTVLQAPVAMGIFCGPQHGHQARRRQSV